MLIFGKRLSELVGRRGAQRWVAVGVGVLAIPAAVYSALNGDAETRAAFEVKPKEGVGKAAPAGGAQLRCWQYGRLILEENSLGIPGESAAYTLRMTDRNRTPVYLVESGTTTCLIKTGSEPSRTPGRP